MKIAKWLTLLPALAAIGAPEVCEAVEIQYRQQFYGADFAVDPRNSFNKRSTDELVFAGNPEKGMISFTTPMNVVTLHDDTGLLGAMLFGTANMYNARQDAINAASRRLLKPGEKIEYTYQAGTYAPGLRSYLSIGWGESAGAIVDYPNWNAGTKMNQNTVNKPLFVDIGIPVPLWQNEHLALGGMVEVFYRNFSVTNLAYEGPGNFGENSKRKTLNETQILLPLSGTAAWQVLPGLTLRGTAGIDPIWSALATLTQTDVNLGTQLGVDVDWSPFENVTLNAGYRYTRGNVSTDRLLVGSAPFVSGALGF